MQEPSFTSAALLNLRNPNEMDASLEQLGEPVDRAAAGIGSDGCQIGPIEFHHEQSIDAIADQMLAIW